MAAYGFAIAPSLGTEGGGRPAIRSNPGTFPTKSAGGSIERGSASDIQLRDCSGQQLRPATHLIELLMSKVDSCPYMSCWKLAGCRFTIVPNGFTCRVSRFWDAVSVSISLTGALSPEQNGLNASSGVEDSELRGSSVHKSAKSVKLCTKQNTNRTVFGAVIEE